MFISILFLFSLHLNLFWDSGGVGIPGLNILWVAAKLGNPCRGEYKNPHFSLFSISLTLTFRQTGQIYTEQFSNRATPECAWFEFKKRLQQKPSWTGRRKRAINTLIGWFSLDLPISLLRILRRINFLSFFYRNVWFSRNLFLLLFVEMYLWVSLGVLSVADPLSIDCFSHLTESQIIPLVKCQELHYFLTSFETNL